MTNEEVKAMRVSLNNAKLVAKLVANNYTGPFDPKVVELARRYNGEFWLAQCTLRVLARTLKSQFICSQPSPICGLGALINLRFMLHNANDFYLTTYEYLAAILVAAE